MFDKSLWDGITTAITQYDYMVSNPPYGSATKIDKEYANWLSYSGERELMAIELCLRYAKAVKFIIPPVSCGFQYSGRPYNVEDKESSKVTRLREAIGKPFYFYCDGIDTAIYRDEWKNTNIITEVADICFEENF